MTELHLIRQRKVFVRSTFLLCKVDGQWCPKTCLVSICSEICIR